MKARLWVAAIGIAISGSSFAAIDLGVLDASGTSFSKGFARIFGLGSKLGRFTDQYTFTLIGAGKAEGGATVAMEWGSLDLALTAVSLKGGTLGSTLTDRTPDNFSFSGLGAGTYSLDISGNLKNVGGPIGYASYSGSISSIASPTPEPEGLAMLMAGLALVAWMVRSRWQRVPTSAGVGFGKTVGPASLVGSNH